MERSGAAVGAHEGEIGIGVDFDIDVLFGGLVAVAVAGFAQHGKRAQVLELEFAFADIDLGDFDQVGHEVVELLRFLAGGRRPVRPAAGSSSPPNPWPSA